MPTELIGQGDITKGHYSTTERIDQIMRYLNDGKIRSTSEIAKHLKMRGSTKLRALLKAMWRDQLILGYVETAGFRWQINANMQLPLVYEEQESI